ncbi:Protein of unknown function [Propionibacterium freudenreichii]|nr:Protein of unknown function [Propionibacterium freudenreichii]CEI27408.1 Protein of unknown function [Propionibacterium freudenreichii]CEI50294.1 Protein of unknown function [Propionibacterium freudenreichii]
MRPDASNGETTRLMM